LTYTQFTDICDEHTCTILEPNIVTPTAPITELPNTGLDTGVLFVVAVLVALVGMIMRTAVTR